MLMAANRDINAWVLRIVALTVVTTQSSQQDMPFTLSPYKQYEQQQYKRKQHQQLYTPIQLLGGVLLRNLPSASRATSQNWCSCRRSCMRRLSAADSSSWMAAAWREHSCCMHLHSSWTARTTHCCCIDPCNYT